MHWYHLVSCLWAPDFMITVTLMQMHPHPGEQVMDTEEWTLNQTLQMGPESVLLSL